MRRYIVLVLAVLAFAAVTMPAEAHVLAKERADGYAREFAKDWAQGENGYTDAGITLEVTGFVWGDCRRIRARRKHAHRVDCTVGFESWAYREDGGVVGSFDCWREVPWVFRGWRSWRIRLGKGGAYGLDCQWDRRTFDY